jgi:probable HAF family extracellular repeat protein
MIGLGDLPEGSFASEPFGMNRDASVIVGKASSRQGVEAMRWTETSGMQGLGDLPGGTFESIAFDVSADGRAVVGFGTTAEGQEAFLWTETQRMRPIHDILLEVGVTAAAGWKLTEATGISAAGDVFIGNGVNPSGQTEGWIAVLRGQVAAGWRPLGTGHLVSSRQTHDPLRTSRNGRGQSPWTGPERDPWSMDRVWTGYDLRSTLW